MAEILQLLRQAQARLPWLMPLLAIILLIGLMAVWRLHREASSELALAHGEIAALHERQKTLINRLAESDADSQVYRTAQLALRRRVDEQAQTITAVNRQLDFYRLLMEGSDSRNGLDLTGSLIYPLDDVKNGYHFRFTFVQYAKRRQVLRATLSIVLQGVQAGMPKRYPLNQLLVSSENSTKLRFKYFQSIEGQLRLPDAFEPQQFVIDAQIKSKNAKPWQRIVEWQTEE
ncbi:Uncharacterised protein [BD1-7 clade bacterium]|uniref:Uncharacterized protein n=1 Tax=BD1-7 clade bacterium TaxID=2029982 RepID=A0A5S9N8T9_9GAMM|nr:Uncharacterised protein [BD1-7 clade bacterium]CAA0085455.1 Uncharacterised protein [BD1-7 clade bacterium]